ncbi:MAG: hypothetical protein ACREA0_21700 [bacterium]
MRHPSSTRRSLAVAAVVIAAALLNACTAWRTATLEPQRFTSEKSPKQVRVTLVDSTRFEVRHPVIVGDSLIWMVRKSPAETSRQAVALGTIRSVQIHGTDPTLTTLLVVGLVGLSAISVHCGAPPGC